MENPSLFFSTLLLFLVLALRLSGVVECNFSPCESMPASDNDVLKFASNFQYLEAELFMNSATGKGIDTVDPSLASGGPPPIGAQMANLDPPLPEVIEELARQEIRQIRAVKNATGGGLPRAELDLRKEVVADLMNKAAGYPLIPPFNPYANNINFLLLVNILTYNGQIALAGALLVLPQSRKLLLRLLAVQAGQNAIIRTLLFQKANEMVVPYNMTVAEFTNRTSTLMNQLGKCGFKDEGLVVPSSLGAENQTDTNILAADAHSLSFTQSIPELLRKVYLTGNESIPGGFFPRGANGRIARSYLPPSKTM